MFLMSGKKNIFIESKTKFKKTMKKFAKGNKKNNNGVYHIISKGTNTEYSTKDVFDLIECAEEMMCEEIDLADFPLLEGINEEQRIDVLSQIAYYNSIELDSICKYKNNMVIYKKLKNIFHHLYKL